MAEEVCSNNQSYPALSDQVILVTQITASTTCILSIFGASLIIFTYAAFKNLRTTTRQLLVNLSVADLIIALSAFVGLCSNYKRFITEDEVNSLRVVSNTSYADPLCISQAAFTMYGTLVSLLLSMFIAVYLLVVMHFESLNAAKRFVPFIYVVSWASPVLIVISVAAIQSFGFEAISDVGRFWVYKNKH